MRNLPKLLSLRVVFNIIVIYSSELLAFLREVIITVQGDS